MGKKRVLDENTLFILWELVKNGRIKYTKIAKSLGITPAAIKERVERLISKGLIKISGLTKIKEIFPFSAILLINAESQIIKKIISKISNCPLVLNISKVSGKYNLVLTILGRNLSHLEEFAINKIKSEKIKDFEMLVSPTFIIPEYQLLKIRYPFYLETFPCGLSKKDADKCVCYKTFIKALETKKVRWK